MIDNLPMAVRHLLTQHVPLVTAVGGVGRITINHAGQEDSQTTAPYLRIVETEVEDYQHKDMSVGGISKHHIVIDAYHAELRQLVDIRTMVRTVLHDYQGIVGEIAIQDGWVTDQTMGRDDDTNLNIYRDTYCFRVIT